LQPNCAHCTLNAADAFITEFDPAGALVFSTYLGGAGNEQSAGIVLSPSGKVFVAGNTESYDFPIANPYQSAIKVDPYSHCDSTCDDVFAAEIDLSSNLSPDLTLTASPTSATISPGQVAFYAVRVSAVGGLSGPATISCSGAPLTGSCVVGPTPYQLNGVETVMETLSVATTAASASAAPMRRTIPPPADFVGTHARHWLLLITLLLAVFALSARMKGILSLRMAAVALALVFSFGCGGGNSTGGGQSPSQSGTPPGTYTITVTATSGSITRSVTVQTVVR
jgi:hypothetical protein